MAGQPIQPSILHRYREILMKAPYEFSHPAQSPIVLPMANLPPLSRGPTLTPRQRDVLLHLAKGDSTKAICRSLALSEGTIKVHLAALMRCFNARNRTEVVVAAMRWGHVVLSSSAAMAGSECQVRDVPWPPRAASEGAASAIAGRSDLNPAALPSPPRGPRPASRNW